MNVQSQGHRRYRLLIFLPVLFVLSGFHHPAASQLLPPETGVEWMQIATEHFQIHYPRENEALAIRLSVIAEETYRRFSTDFGLRPRGRVEVFLQNSYDIVNSAASPILHRSIFIFPDLPYGLPHSALGHYRDWLSLAFTHEYAHMVDLDRASGLWSAVHLFTGLGYPNLFKPLWTIEGFAVWAETVLTGAGRLGSPAMEMVLRADIIGGTYRTPDQWSGVADPWPAGSLPYLYGAAFMRFIGERYGPDAGRRFRAATAGSLPWSYAGSLPIATGGMPFTLVLSQFYEDLRNRAQRSLAWITDQGPIREGELILKPGTVVLDLLPSADGRRLYIARDVDQGRQRIIALDLETSETQRLRDTSALDLRLSESRRSGAIVFSDLDITANARLVSRLYSMTDRGGSHRELSPVGRLHEPAVSPIDDSVVACLRENGRSTLVRLEGASIVPVPVPIPGRVDLFHPAWAPDGSALVVSAWRPPGRQEIWLIDLRAGAARPLTEDEHWNITPVFSPDGRYVFFSSDRSGVWNIDAIEVESGSLYQVTNVTTGAFLPEVSPDGETIYFVRYSSSGDEVRRLDLDPDTWIPVEPDAQPMLPEHREYLDRYREAEEWSGSGAASGQAAPPPAGRKSSLRKLRFLRPLVHLPIPQVDEKGLVAGLLLLGADPLGQTGYIGWAGYGIESSRPSYGALFESYLSSRLRLGLAASDLALPTGDLSSDLSEDRWRRIQSYSLSLSSPFLELTRSAEIRTTLTVERVRAIDPDGANGALPPPAFYTGHTTEIAVGVRFSNAKLYPLSFSPEDGFFAASTWRFREKILGGDRLGTLGEIDLRGYQGITDGFILAVRGLAARATRGTIEFGRGGDLTVTGLDSLYTTTQALVAAGETRLRVTEIQEKFLWDWLFLHRVHGALFGEIAWTDPARGDPRAAPADVWSFGGRLGLDMTLGYMFRFTMSMVLAKPSTGDPVAFLSFAAPF